MVCQGISNLDVNVRRNPSQQNHKEEEPSSPSPLVRLVEGEERWEASDHPQSVLPLNWGGIEPNRTVICMMLKATANDRRHLALCHDEFRWPRSGLCRSGGIGNNSNNIVNIYQSSFIHHHLSDLMASQSLLCSDAPSRISTIRE
ncbi:uncharacterized protein TNCV_4604231 [Trichonephila clavipes]|nr:uncharacterized protein TNCV_4604231 [Trichonephila clavipes]